MSLQSISLKGIAIITLSLLCTIGAINYAGAVTGTGTKVQTKKISCSLGSEPNARGTKCSVCKAGKVSTNGLSCRACRGDNIASNKGAVACTPCPAGSKANKAHTACIKQRYVSGERK